jgi:cytidylate kinase
MSAADTGERGPGAGPAGPLTIAIDGPAAAGKSTTARAVAERLGLLYIDSGAMYRALALKLLRSDTDAHDPEALARFLAATTVDLVPAGKGGEPRVLLDGREVTAELRDERVAALASTIAPLRAVRTYLVARQRALAARTGAVMEGRDIGTVVLPDAPIKVFLVADLDVRAVRRAGELALRGEAPDLDAIRALIAERDRRDMERTESPLRPAPDAITIDTSALTIPEQVAAVVALVESRSGGRAPEPPTGSGSAPPRPRPARAAVTDLALDPEVRGFYAAVRHIARACFRLGFGMRVEGTEHLPARGGFILAANHAAWVDPPLLGAAATRRLGYLAKEELFVPFGFRHLIVALGAIPIRRRHLDRGGLEVAKKVLASGLGLVLFPEGTRSRTGRLGPGKPGVSMLAAEAGVPVVPAYIQGTRCLWGAFLRRSPFRIRFGPPLGPPRMGQGPAWREEMRAHTGRIMDAIAGLDRSPTAACPPP